MVFIRGNSFSRGHTVAAFALLWLCAAAPLAFAQSNPPQAKESPANNDFFAKIGRWFDEQAASFNSNFKSTVKTTKEGLDNFGHEAGMAAKATGDAAKGAVDAVGKLTNTHVVRGHQKCNLAANGAPDCVAAANAVCKAGGYTEGKSVDMTTAEDCPPGVWLSGRTEDSQCKTITFVSRAVCR